MDIQLLAFFRDEVIAPVSKLDEKVDALNTKVDGLAYRLDAHEASAKKRAEDRAAKVKSMKRAVIGLASVAGPIVVGLVLNALGVSF